MDEESLASRAALPRAEERGDKARLGRSGDVGVLEHDHRPVAAELEQHRLPGCPRRHLQPGLDGADEADRVRSRAPGDLVADDGTPARDHREDTGWELGVHDALRKLHGADRGRRGGSPDDGVPGCERGREELGGHRVRPVPRRDHADDAARDAVAEDPLRRVDRRRHRPVQPLHVCGRHPPVLDQLVHLAIGLAVQRLALIERQRQRELVSALDDQVCDPLHRRCALEGRAARPVAPGAVRRRDRPFAPPRASPPARSPAPRRSRGSSPRAGRPSRSTRRRSPSRSPLSWCSRRERLPVDLLVGRNVYLTRVPERLRILVRDARQHRDLVLREAQLGH